MYTLATVPQNVLQIHIGSNHSKGEGFALSGKDNAPRIGPWFSCSGGRIVRHDLTGNQGIADLLCKREHLCLHAVDIELTRRPDSADSQMACRGITLGYLGLIGVDPLRTKMTIHAPVRDHIFMH
jgi:hypothetical protein